jgi:hypothetical protein
MRAGAGTFAIVDFEMGEHATRLLLQDLGATLDEIRSVYYTEASGPAEQAPGRCDVLPCLRGVQGDVRACR